MPFRLVNSESAFIRMTRKLLHGCSNADNNVDDILRIQNIGMIILLLLETFSQESEIQD